MGLKCSVDQLLSTGLFHADPHRGNLLRSPSGELSFIDFGMMADVTEEERYGLIGLAIGLQNKDLSLVTENLLKVCFRFFAFVSFSILFTLYAYRVGVITHQFFI